MCLGSTVKILARYNG